MFCHTPRSPQLGLRFDRPRVIRLRRIRTKTHIKTIASPIPTTTIGFQINRGRITIPASTEITATIINSETTIASLRKPDSQRGITGIHPRGWWYRGGSRANSTPPCPTSASSGRRKMDTGIITTKAEINFPKNRTATDTETKMETTPARKRVIKTAINARPTAAATTTASATARCPAKSALASSRGSSDKLKPPRPARVPESPAALPGTRALFPAATNGPSTPRARLFPLTGPAPDRPRYRGH